MRHEKIIKRADGSRVKIVVRFCMPLYRECIYYETYVYICQPGKGIFNVIFDVNNYRYRSLSMEERAAYKDAQILKHVSADELLSAKIELWELIKPS